MKKIILSVVFGLMAFNEVMALGTGLVTYPLMPGKRTVSTEVTGVTSTGGGVGIQGRFTQRINEKMIMDAGIGISGGERDSRFFLGADYELFPDYGRQPRISLKTTFANAKEFDRRKNIFTLAPTLSKGFSFWGEEAYPFISLPFAVNLDSDTKTYETQLNTNLGITGNLPIEGYNNWVATLEATIDVKDSFTGFFVALSYPIN